jgi:hypothetical protein
MDTFLQESDPADVFLPLAGGTMDEDAIITFDNGARLQEGTTDADASGGIALKCSVDYELKWEAGRLYVMGQDGFTIRTEMFGFTAVPTTTDDDTKGYVIGSRRILDDGTVYVCTDATTNTAVWVYQGIRDTANDISIDQENRKLITGDGAEMLNWSSSTNIAIPIGITLGVDLIFDADSPSRYIDVANGVLGDYNGTYIPSINWANRQLIASDGVSVSADWYNGYLYDGAEISLDWIYRSLTGSDNLFAINWGDRQLCGTGGSTCVDWSSGTPVFSFGATLTPTAVVSLVGNEGTIAYVNDADTPVIGSAVVGGASAKCLVCYNGTAWIVTSLL